MAAARPTDRGAADDDAGLRATSGESPLLYPIEGTRNRFLPHAVGTLSLIRRELWFPGLFHRPPRGQFLSSFEEADRQSGCVGCAERGGFFVGRLYNLPIQYIGLELHQE